jgi:hypothetical protein
LHCLGLGDDLREDCGCLVAGLDDQLIGDIISYSWQKPPLIRIPTTVSVSGCLGLERSLTHLLLPLGLFVIEPHDRHVVEQLLTRPVLEVAKTQAELVPERLLDAKLS